MQKKEDIVHFYEQQLNQLQQEKKRAYMRRNQGTIISSEYLVKIDMRIQKIKEIMGTIKEGTFNNY